MKKTKYSLDILEQEIGGAIDNVDSQLKLGEQNEEQQTTSDSPPMGRGEEQPTEPLLVEDLPTAVGMSKPQKKEKDTVMKNIWIPIEMDCRIKLIRAVRQRQRMPHSFNDIANEALVEYLERHLESELNTRH